VSLEEGTMVRRFLFLTGLNLVVSALVVGLSGCAAMKQSFNGKRDRYYEIKSGDTLDSIGSKYGVPAAEIQAYNSIKNPRSLTVGQKIVIPAVGPLDHEPEGSGNKPMGDDANRAQLRMVSLAPVRGYVGQLEFPVEEARYTSRLAGVGASFTRELI